VRVFLFSLFIIFLFSCRENVDKTDKEAVDNDSGWISRPYLSLEQLPDQKLTELQPCDILVKPNLNWIPGTTNVTDGIGFGHAAIVIKGASDTSEVSLLSSVLTFESQARDVPPEFQVRKVNAYVPGNDFSYANYNFKPSNLGRYYRLRMNLTYEEKEAIIKNLLDHDSSLSNPRSLKDYHEGNSENNQNGGVEYTYCSLIIWQAFYDVLGMDLDANQGLYVYPNDLINSPYFDTRPGEKEKRSRF
jgi:hypothetical protein